MLNYFILSDIFMHIIFTYKILKSDYEYSNSCNSHDYFSQLIHAFYYAPAFII